MASKISVLSQSIYKTELIFFKPVVTVHNPSLVWRSFSITFLKHKLDSNNINCPDGFLAHSLQEISTLQLNNHMS